MNHNLNYDSLVHAPEKEIRLPLLAVTGLLNIFIPNIKNTDDKKYKITYEEPISYHPFF